MAAVITAVVVLGAGPAALVAQPRDTAPAALGERELCGIELVMYVETDQDLTATAEKLREDPKARRVLTETKQQAYERFKEMFANRPELLGQTSPDSLPAVVHLVPVAGTDPEAWAADLRQRFPEAEKVDVLDPAPIAARMKVTPPPCPPSGER
ncbi:permease-like cell division protein FtsX [Amycolatopsis coloradensis]|uniref:permease-like cell division protein FtsX n=1 Tax=Amycolatopsis coloradensis TaxID=76021 RepID=UPI0011787DAC|nr:permease-like cell division protein FtsX [Amycolatopsis coloradensis]